MALKALRQEDFTILDNQGDRWNVVKSFRSWNYVLTAEELSSSDETLVYNQLPC